MKTQNLVEYVKSLPIRGDQHEKLRQERILQSINERTNSIRSQEISEMQSLMKAKALTEREKNALRYLTANYPDEAEDLQTKSQGRHP
jgi:hypothetical protein